MGGTLSFPLNKLGLTNLPPMLTVWSEISTEATSDAAFMTRLNSPTVDLRATESDVPPKRTSDTTVKTLPSEPNKSARDSKNGLSDTCLNALARKTTTTRSTVCKNGRRNFRPTSLTKLRAPETKLLLNNFLYSF